jgi:ferredoxin, 2Fe-2S
LARVSVTRRSGEEVVIESPSGVSLMELLRDRDLDIAAVCGGCCSCSTCHVLVHDDWIDKLPPRSADEQELLLGVEAYDSKRSRLACQVHWMETLDGMKLTVAPE